MRFVAIFSLLIVLSSAFALASCAQEGEEEWTVGVLNEVVFVGENVTINVSGPPGAPFIMTIMNETMNVTHMKQYVLPLSGETRINYSISTVGTYFIYIGDGTSYYVSIPASFIIIIEEISQTRDDLQDEFIQQIYKGLLRQGEIIVAVREWAATSMAYNVVLTGLFIILMFSYVRHIIHEHKEYFHRTEDSEYPPEKGLRGIWKKLFFDVGHYTGELLDWKWSSHTSMAYDQIGASDVRELQQKMGKIDVKERILKKFKHTCQNCGVFFNAYGEKTPCPGCGASADYVGDGGEEA